MKTIAILIPTYKRFNDLVNTLEKTTIDERAKFVIVANLTDDELNYINKKYSHKSIIVDERAYGKLDGCKAYNLAFAIAKENKFDYAILYADDIIPFRANWLDKLYSQFIVTNGRFGIFSTDECHPGYYGWNIMLDCPVAHFFIIDCSVTDQLFPDKYIQYVIDLEIAVRLKSQGIDIQLLPIKLNHLRSGLHRDMMDLHMSKDVETFINEYPEYKLFDIQFNLFFLKHNKKSQLFSQVSLHGLPNLADLKPKESVRHKVKVKTKSTLKDIIGLFGYSIKRVPKTNKKQLFKYTVHKKN